MGAGGGGADALRNVLIEGRSEIVDTVLVTPGEVGRI